MVKIAFTVVRVAAQTFYHATWLVLATVYGDDFQAGETRSLDVFDEALEQFLVLTQMPSIGLPLRSEEPATDSSRRGR